MSKEVTITGRVVTWKCENPRPGISFVRCNVQDFLSGEIIENLPAAGLDRENLHHKKVSVTIRILD